MDLDDFMYGRVIQKWMNYLSITDHLAFIYFLFYGMLAPALVEPKAVHKLASALGCPDQNWLVFVKEDILRMHICLLLYTDKFTSIIFLTQISN